jgi:hypothetical protein
MKYTKSQRDAISAQAQGKRIESMEYDEEGAYWVLTFDDGSEMCVRLMTEAGG